MSLVSTGRVSTGGRRTLPAGDTCRYEKSVRFPGRPVGSGTCSRRPGEGFLFIRLLGHAIVSREVCGRVPVVPATVKRA
jgi:hypothetical protein